MITTRKCYRCTHLVHEVDIFDWGEYNLFESCMTFRKESILPDLPFNKDLQPEVYDAPVIINEWRQEGKRTWFRILVPHKHDSCNPRSNCSGIINVRISTATNGSLKGICLSCQEDVNIDLTLLRLELRKVFTAFLGERNLPKV